MACLHMLCYRLMDSLLNCSYQFWLGSVRGHSLIALFTMQSNITVLVGDMVLLGRIAVLRTYMRPIASSVGLSY